MMLGIVGNDLNAHQSLAKIVPVTLRDYVCFFLNSFSFCFYTISTDEQSVLRSTVDILTFNNDFKYTM